MSLISSTRRPPPAPRARRTRSPSSPGTYPSDVLLAGAKLKGSQVTLRHAFENLVEPGGWEDVDGSDGSSAVAAAAPSDA